MFRQRSPEDAEQPAKQVAVAEVLRKGDRLHPGGGVQEWHGERKEWILIFSSRGIKSRSRQAGHDWRVPAPHSEADTKLKPKDNILEMHKAYEIKSAINVSLYQIDSTDAFIDLLIRNLLIHDLLIIDASI